MRFLSGLVALRNYGLCLIYRRIYRFKVFTKNIPLGRFLALSENHRNHVSSVIVESCKSFVEYHIYVLYIIYIICCLYIIHI